MTTGVFLFWVFARAPECHVMPLAGPLAAGFREMVLLLGAIGSVSDAVTALGDGG